MGDSELWSQQDGIEYCVAIDSLIGTMIFSYL